MTSGENAPRIVVERDRTLEEITTDRCAAVADHTGDSKDVIYPINENDAITPTESGLFPKRDRLLLYPILRRPKVGVSARDHKYRSGTEKHDKNIVKGHAFSLSFSRAIPHHSVFNASPSSSNSREADVSTHTYPCIFAF